MKDYASYNSLMKHMRDDMNIEINGSHDKSKLMRMGYYHAVKGYRFFKSANNPIVYRSFSEIQSVVKFDETIKAILYQPIMQLETAIKSYACNDIMNYVKSSNFSDVFEKGFSQREEKKYRTRDQVYAALTKRYASSEIIKHFYSQDLPVPLWAIFEELMLGDLSSIIEVLDPKLKLAISDSFGIPKVWNTKGALLPHIILAIKDLRNAIAHNKVIFDGRYMEFKKKDSIRKCLEDVTKIQDIGSNSLFHDIILMCFLMTNLKFPKKQIQRMVENIEDAVALLKTELPNMLFQHVAGKISEQIPCLKLYIKSLR